MFGQAGAPQLLPGPAVRADVSVLASHTRGEAQLLHHPGEAGLLPAGPRGGDGAPPSFPPASERDQPRHEHDQHQDRHRVQQQRQQRQWGKCEHRREQQQEPARQQSWAPDLRLSR